MSLKVLSKKIKTQIIAVDLIERLVEQIMNFKIREFDNTVNTNSAERLYTSQEIIESSNEEEVSPSKFIAISESVELSPSRLCNENNQPNIEIKKKSIILNPKEVMDSHDFYSIMSITTLVPFIKVGIPRLSEFDIKVAKLNEKEFLRKQKKTPFNSKIFEYNMELRDEIYKYHEDNIEKSQVDQSQQAVPEINEKDSIAILIDDKKESSNIMNNPELKQDESASISFYGKEPAIVDKKRIKQYQLSSSQNKKITKDQNEIKSMSLLYHF